MRVLFLSWRDPRHPRAGGAELFTHEIARRLVAAGDTVEWFVAGFPGSAHEEDMDGVHVVREGAQWSVHMAAARRYRRRLQGSFDVVVDEVNTIPFFTPLWARIPRVLLIFQLAREVWWYESPLPLSAAGFAAEPMYLRVYRRTPSATISASTAADLHRLGFTAPVTILPIGLEAITVADVAKDTANTFIYVGRMAPSKRVHEIVDAFGLYRRQHGDSRLWLVGDGPEKYLKRLQSKVLGLGLQNNVDFLGRLSTEEKHERMARAHVLLMASVREGWGLSIAEAGACRTPAIVYDVPGLRDAVRDDKTGFVVAPRPERMAQAMSKLTSDPELYARVASEAARLSAEFSFDAAATMMRRVLEQAVRTTGTLAPAT